jgi:hypothetical protein
MMISPAMAGTRRMTAASRATGSSLTASHRPRDRASGHVSSAVPCSSSRASSGAPMTTPAANGSMASPWMASHICVLVSVS